jgi:hypothetical protein
MVQAVADTDYQLTKELADDLHCYALEHQLKHRLASSFFHSRFINWSLLPSACLTLVCSISALLPDTVASSTTTSLVTGISAAVSTFLQVFASKLKYNSRADMHEIAAKRFEDLAEQLKRIVIYEESVPQRVAEQRSNAVQSEEHQLDVDKIEQRIQEVNTSCTSAIPSIIESLFFGLVADFERPIENVAKRRLLENLFFRICSSHWWQYQPWWPYACQNVIKEALQGQNEANRGPQPSPGRLWGWLRPGQPQRSDQGPA